MSILKRRFRRIRPRPQDIAAAGALAGGLALTFALVGSMVTTAHERADTIFQRQLDARDVALTRSFAEALDVLNANRALFVAMGAVGRVQFCAFVRPLLDSHAYLRAVAYHRLVDADQRRGFEAARAGLAPDYEIRERLDDRLLPSPRRARYLVVDYIEPMPANAVLLGYDVLSYPDQARTFARAVDSGAPSSTPVLSLLQSPGGGGVAVMAPLYRPGMPVGDVAGRRAAATGAVAVVLDVDLLVERSLSGPGDPLDRPGMALELMAPTDRGPRSVFRVDRLGVHGVPRWHGWPDDPVLRASRRIVFAGQPWELRMAVRSSELAGGVGPAVVLMLGCLFSAALAGYVRARVQRLQHVQGLVRRRTADLLDALGELRLYRRAIDASANAIILIDARRPGLPIDYVNPAFTRMRGYTADQAIGRHLLELGAHEPDQGAVAELRRAIREEREGHVSMRLHCRDEHELHAEVYVAPVRDLDGRVTHFVMTQYDVTRAKRYELELEKRARFDALTGLPNRALLHDRIESAIRAAGPGRPVWVVALDLDHFKYVNDTLGHAAGAARLKAAAERIAGALGRGDTAARTGGDEFVLVLPGRADETDAVATVRAVLGALARPLRLEGEDLVMTGSAGVAGFPADGDTAPVLIQHAETAMYRAKDMGRNTVQYFMPSMNVRARERLALEAALRGAVQQNEFEL
jgi:diguanylate cyclase (GGDEF)-like protein/PAS domain S-box-containing protein